LDIQTLQKTCQSQECLITGLKRALSSQVDIPQASTASYARAEVESLKQVLQAKDQALIECQASLQAENEQNRKFENEIQGWIRKSQLLEWQVERLVRESK
jgi:hypothetical protein